MKTLKIAAINVGKFGHGHNASMPPIGIMTVVGGIYHFLSQELKEKIEIKIFDQVLLGEILQEEVEKFQPNALLISVQISGYYSLALPIFKWASDHNIPVLAGGQHFRVPDIENGMGILPGTIARIAAEKRRMLICYGEGEQTSAKFVEFLFGKCTKNSIPNICYWEDQGLMITRQEAIPIGSLPYPALPRAVIDVAEYWKRIPHNFVQKNELVNGSRIGRTIVAPNCITGCGYRQGQVSRGKTGCNYCALTTGCAETSGKRFWELLREMCDYVQSIPWNGDEGIMVYHPGDDAGSRLKFIQSVWETKPDWIKNVPLRHRMYAWFISKKLALMLRDIGVQWVLIGADGKKGWTNKWSRRHPLIETLRSCRLAGIKVHLNFVLGQRNQSWQDIEAWDILRKQLVENFPETILATDGWVNVIVPGSSDWQLMERIAPELTETDCPDLEEIQLRFWKHCTPLCDGGISPKQVREMLYVKSAEFEGISGPPQKTWMLS